MPDLLPRIEIDTASNPRSAVIWLHGLGADGNDFVPLVDELDLTGCPSIRFVFPHAPEIAVTLNAGHVMPAWYDIQGTALQRDEDRDGITASAIAIAALIENEVRRGIEPSAIVLAGFSQGCAMALHTGLRHPTRLAGIVALSGYLPLADTLASQCSAANRTTPIFLAHGDDDAVVPLARATSSLQVLRSLDYRVQWHRYPMEHSLHSDEIADIAGFLREVLCRDRSASGS